MNPAKTTRGETANRRTRCVTRPRMGGRLSLEYARRTQSVARLRPRSGLGHDLAVPLPGEASEGIWASVTTTDHDGAAAGWNSSTRFPEGSTASTCAPPGPVTISLRNRTPSS